MRFGETVNSLEEYIPFSYKPGIIRLDANESCLELPDEIKTQVLNAVNNVEFNRYPDPYCKELRRYYAEYYGIDSENIVVGNGSDELISIIFSSLVPIDAKVLTVTPDFSMYSFYATLYGRKNSQFNKNTEFNIDVDSFVNTINDGKYDFVMFSNPCNPTGQCLSRNDILHIVKKTSAVICVDEAYMDFWDENESVMKDVNTYENLLVLRTLSKAIGLASCRLGFAVANRNIISMFNKVKSPYNVNSISQAIGCCILSSSDYLRLSAETIKKQTMELYNSILNLKIKDAKVFNTKTNFVYIQVPYARRVFDQLKEKNIIIRCFGSDRLRITAGTETENKIVLQALEEICS
ncbi:MAG: histidinol-phosphate transaminase [Ruminococcaceae bacterium]|nr:histidinol-phosphate transaminase [Oscillospiraceae bacterium]